MWSSSRSTRPCTARGSAGASSNAAPAPPSKGPDKEREFTAVPRLSSPGAAPITPPTRREAMPHSQSALASLMNIHEHQAKAVLAEYGVAVPKGYPAFTVDEAVDAAKKLGGPVFVVKSQIH